MNRLFKNSGNQLVKKTLLLGAMALVMALPRMNAFAETSSMVLANRLASRIATYLPAATITNMSNSIASGDYVGAAKLATQSTSYGDNFLFNLVAPMCSLANTQNVPSNACIATLQYIAWNNKPWTDALTGNYLATFTAPTGVTAFTAPSAANNTHWQAATTAYLAGQMSYVANMNMVAQTSVNTQMTDPMGVMTVYQAGYDAANMGTNRRFVEIIMQNFLGVTLDSVRDGSFGTTAAVDRIRQDVQGLAPDTATFLNTCATCHGGIDGMASAFNGFDTSATTFQLTLQNSVVTKLTSRETLHAASPGFKESLNSPSFNSWVINYRTSPYGTFSWGATSGVGANALGQSVVATNEFRINMINRIWNLACGEPPPASELTTVEELASYMLTTAQDQITPMVQQVATLPQCLGR